MPSTTVTPSPSPSVTTPDHVDVLIVGAGLSGIGVARHLQARRPGTTFAILEGRAAMGGTWDLFRYPGIRSDSDLHTFGYAFKPWTGDKAIADGPSILRYIEETAIETGVDAHIRFGHRVVGAAWSTDEARWTVEAVRTDTDETVHLTCNWLFAAGGYYRYDEGHTPHFEGIERFAGQVVHPQHWPQDLDYAGKRVVVIGSGATAVTLVPAMTDRAAHVTMLQRSPTYVLSVPEKDPIANALRRILPAQLAYDITRRKNIWLQRTTFRLSQSRPRLVRWILRRLQRRQLPEGYDVDTHFNPSYDPWDQRLCAVPDGDLFKAISAGDASVVTDRIDTFTERGIRLASGVELEADIVVTATGLSLLAFGGMELSVDGTPVNLPDTLAYKAMMLSDVPNFAFAIGYTNSSWTLKVDLVAEYLCRLLGYMDQRGLDTCVPVNDDPTLTTRPLLDFGAGYVRRAVDRFPRQGSRAPWDLNMSFAADVKALRHGTIDDGVVRFSRGARRRTTDERPDLVVVS
jgi:cation diffusion facilitator CzcD-associated flavoprotein CzcO